jgi:hypothetical protein
MGKQCAWIWETRKAVPFLQEKLLLPVPVVLDGNPQIVQGFPAIGTRKVVNVPCWACIGRVLHDVWTAVVVIGMCIGRVLDDVLDDVWTTVTVIGLNSRSNRSEQSPAGR